MIALTAWQKRVFAYISSYVSTSGASPTLSEIQAEMGIKWKAQVEVILIGLEKKSLIRRKRYAHRGITICWGHNDNPK